MTIQSQDIDALIQLFDSSDWDEMYLKIEGFEVFLSTDANGRKPEVSGSAVAVARPVTRVAGAAQAPVARSDPGFSGSAAVSSGGPSPQAPPSWVAVTAPNLGTFYRAPKPGAPSFVDIGQSVDVDTEICLIEVMKLFTSLRAGVRGILRQVCVKDAALVQFGETLFYIEPV